MKNCIPINKDKKENIERQQDSKNKDRVNSFKPIGDTFHRRKLWRRKSQRKLVMTKEEPTSTAWIRQ